MKSSELPDSGSAEVPTDKAPAVRPVAQVPAVRSTPTATPPRRKRRSGWIWAAAGGAGVVAAAISAYLFWAPVPVLVTVEQAAYAPVTRLLAVNGRIESLQSVEVRSLLRGALSTVEVAEGDAVAAGQVLARIDTAAQDAVVRQAMAGLDSALVSQAQAQSTYTRSLALGNNVAAVTLDVDRRAVEAAAQEVARMTAVLEQAQVQLENHTLRAPISGTVLVMDAEAGQIVDTATVLMTLADVSVLVVETDVDETHATQIAAGQPAVLRLAGETLTRPGHVHYVSGVVDAATGGLAVKIAFDDPVDAPVGLTVTANIVVDQRESALTVPRTAIVTTEAGKAVFVARDDVAVQQPVAVIEWPAARLVVTEGLAEGDRVIVDAANLVDGQPVRVATP